MLDNGEYEKAAAWALFHDDVGNCIKSLAASGNPQNKIIATALAGYPGRSYTSAPTAASSVASSPGSASPGNVSALQMALWKDLSDSIMNPFLRAAFLFASSGGNFHSVLGVLELALCDRVGIALRFLPDNEVGGGCLFGWAMCLMTHHHSITHRLSSRLISTD